MDSSHGGRPLLQPLEDGTLPVLCISAFRRSGGHAHVQVTHVDYHQHPSRSWLVAEYDVAVPKGSRALDAAVAVAAGLLGEAGGAPVLVEAVSPGQLMLW